MFLKLNEYAEVANAVNKNVGSNEYCFAVVQALDQRGLIDAKFLDRLAEQRPAKVAQIKSLEQFWLDDENRP